jgi:hypothetical protein
VLLTDGRPGDSGRQLHCLDGRTGSAQWQLPLDQEASGEFVLIGPTVLVQAGSNEVAGVDLAGRLLWHKPLGRLRGLPAGRHQLGVLALADLPRLVALDLPTGAELWRAETEAVTGPVVEGGTLFLGVTNGICARRLTDGHVLWLTPLATPAQPLSLSGGVLATVTSSNELVVLDARSGRIQSRIPGALATQPPVIPWQTAQRAEGQTSGSQAASHSPAVISVQNVYESDQPWPEGTQIKWLRVVQVYPPARSANYTEIGFDREQLARMPLGVVPVEADGSAYFEAPVGKTLLFQALDQEGRALQTMRSATYVHPGEHLSCVGCHERNTSGGLSGGGTPLALKRTSSKLASELGRVEPLSFHRHIKPILESKYAPCHREKQAPPDMSYASLDRYAFYFASDIGHGAKPEKNVPAGRGASRSIPGKIGARAAKLTPFLDATHYDVQLTPDDRRRLTLWLDCGSPQFGVYPRDVGKAETKGELVWPLLDVDPINPTGVERTTAMKQEHP